MIQRLGDLWAAANYKKHTRVRYIGWDFRNKFFEIHQYSDCFTKIQGALDTGERMSFSVDSDNWILYESGAEEGARAV